jgi:hypothetical protein
MIEEAKKYRIAFATYEAEKHLPGQSKMGRIYFTKDTLSFDTRADLMEFFDNPEKIFAHLRDTDILKMMLHKNEQGKKIVPVVEIMPYLQGDGTRLYFDERREVEIAVEGNKDNKVHNGNIINATHQKLFIDKGEQGEWDAQPVKL